MTDYELLIKRLPRTIELAMRAVTPQWEWSVCPGCNKQGSTPTTPPTMPQLYVLEDENHPAKWLIIHGWICCNSLHGTVVLRGPQPEKGEDAPVQMTAHGRKFFVQLDGRFIYPYTGPSES